MPNPDPIGTVPESLLTLLHQQFQLEQGKRSVMLFPLNQEGNIQKCLPLPCGMEKYDCKFGRFHYNPGKISFQQIQDALDNDTIGQLLLLGPYSKSDIDYLVAKGAERITVVERSPFGVEIRAATTTVGLVPEIIEYFWFTRDPSSIISLEPEEFVLNWRLTHP